MVKYSLETKLSTVQDYLEGTESYLSLEKRTGIDYRFIMNWVSLYENHGVEGLIPSYTNYSVEFKMDVLKFMNDTGTSYRKTAAIFNIPAPSTILQWKKILEEQGVDALHSRKRGRPSMKKESKKKQPVEGSQEALLAEIERLRMENAYLKKLNALVQEERKSQSARKRK